MESLERKMEKPGWKQWLPFGGIYQVEKDSSDNKLSIFDEEYGNKMLIGAVAVHAGYILIAGAGALYWLHNLLDK